MEVRSTLRTRDFILQENRLEFDYSFQAASGNSTTAHLHRASDNLQLSSKVLSGGAVGWTRVRDWNWSPSDYIGTSVYVRFVNDDDAKPAWVDNVGVNLMDGLFRDGYPSQDAGDPFDTSTAQSLHTHTDIAIPGKGIPLEFTRHYNSMSATAGSLGYNWRHNYSTALRIDADQSVMVTYGSGGSAFFKYNAGTLLAPAGVFDTLVKNGDNTYTLTTKSQVQYHFDTAGRLDSIKDRNNNTTALYYTTGGVLGSVADSGGRFLTFGYDVSDRINSVTDYPPGRRVEYTYDANGDLWKVKDVKADPINGPFTVYSYSNHRMISLTDSNGHLQNTTIYDGANRVVEQTDAMGGKTCSYYGTPPAYTSPACPGVTPSPAAGQTVVVNPRGFKTTYDFDTRFRTTGITDHNGGATTFTFDPSNNVTCVTDQRAKKTAYRLYDPKGNAGEIIDALNTDATCALKTGGVKWTYTYTSNNDIDLETDPLGRQTDYIYDSSGNLTRIARKDSGGAVKALTCLERDLYGQPTATVQSTNLVIPGGATSPCTGNKTVLGYDNYGNLTCTVNARFTGTTTCASDPGPKATFIYDVMGRLLYATNENTNNTKPVRGTAPETGSQCGTDGNGNGVNDDSPDDTTIDDGCPSSKYTYDAQNNVLTTTDGLGNVTTSAYDAKGNLTSVKDANRKTAGANPESGTAQCGTDGTGDGENDDPGDDVVTDDGCLSVVYKYDNADRLVTVIQAAVSTTTIPTTSYGYDGNGNRTSVTSPKRQAAGTAESGGQCGTAGTGNDVDEDSDTVKDDGCPSTKYAFDNLDRLQTSTDALGRATAYQYDAASNLTQRTDARNLVTKYFPDDANRLDLIEHWNGMTLVDSVDYIYNAVGFRTQMVDPTGTTTYTPDALDRIGSVTFPGPKTVGYTYDDAPGGSAADFPGQRTKITYPDSKTVDYTYLADGHMSTVTDWLAKQTSYTYDDAGRLTTTQLPNGVYTHHIYDAAERLTCVLNDRTASTPSSCTSGTVISKFEYTLDSAGNRTQTIDPQGTHTYGYDPLHRLTQWFDQARNYGYDAAGNRTSVVTGIDTITQYRYDAADQMVCHWSVPTFPPTDCPTGFSTFYGYDENGNQTSRGADTFAYDHENRLTQTVIGGFTSSSVYNGDGLRMSHTVGAQTTNYTWDAVAGLPVVLQDGTNTYVYGLDLISSTDSGGAQTYFLYDGLGSTTGLTDSNGSVTATYWYDVFGAILSQTGTSANYWLFTGEQRDSDSSLYYLRARYYDPAIGRFLERDPAEAGHPYAYVENNPIIYTDPYGLDVCSTVTGAVTSVFGGKKKDCSETGDALLDVAEGAACGSAQTMIPCGMVGLGPLGDSYFDLNLTVGCWAVVSVGVQYSADQGFHPYYGPGGGCAGLPIPINVTPSVAPGYSITPGRNCGFQVGVIGPSFVGGAVQVGLAPVGIKEGVSFKGAKEFIEIGPSFGNPGGSGSVTCIMVAGNTPISW